MIDRLLQQRYLLLSVILTLHVAINATNGIWVDDFWEHSANVREFIAHTFSAEHPFFNVSAQHAYQNPYSYLVAILGKIFDLDSINALALFSVVNFILLCWGLRLFISTFDDKNQSSIAFYSLVFMLILWGNNPWTYSSFFNYQAILSVLPLPSAFTYSIALICLKINFNKNENNKILRTIAVVLIATISLLSHPLTTMFLFSGLVAQSINERKFKNITETIFIIGTAFLLAELWPYFSIFKLLTSNGSVYHEANKILYSEPVEKIWYVLILIPFAVKEILAKKNRTLIYLIIILIGIYAYGYSSGKYAYGRAISYVVMMMQILIAQAIVNYQIWIAKKSKEINKKIEIFLMITLIVISSRVFVSDFRRSLTIINSIIQNRPIVNEITYKEYTFIKKIVKQDEVVLANLENSYIIPSFNGKVIAIQLPVAFLDDIDLRRKDIIDFFNCPSDGKLQINILEKYQPKYILLDKINDHCYEEIFKVINKNIKSKNYESSRFVLFELKYIN